MFKTTALDSVGNVYIDKDVPSSTPGTRVEADDRNITQDELVAQVESSGQTLDPTGVKRNQVARAMFLNAVGAQSMIDNGGANSKLLIPVTGASGYVFGETYAQLSGAVFLFKNLVTNTGAVTINCGPTVGTLLGVKSFTKAGGVAFAASELIAGDYYAAIYDLANDRFELPVNSMLVSDLAYSSAWNGVTDKAPSQNALYDIISILSAVPSGERILFYKNAAVFGYSLLDTLDDKVVYVTKGSVAGGQTGGTVHNFGSWTISGLAANAHSITEAELPVINFEVRASSSGTGGTANAFTRGVNLDGPLVDTTSKGSGTGHIHGVTHTPAWRPAAYCFTIQQRN